MTGLRELLDILQSLDLIAQKQDEPDLEYAFKHIFTQETICNSLLNTDRRQLHQQLGEALETIVAPSSPTAARLEEIAPLLTYHFE